MSAGLRSERWGSHWRWRWMLAAILLALMVCAYQLAEQWISKGLLRPRNESPAVVLVQRRFGLTVEAFDWMAGKRYKVADVVWDLAPPDMAVARDGKAIAWPYRQQVHIVDIEPPHEKTVYRIEVDVSKHRFLGLSSDSRFAVYQAQAVRTTNADGSTSLTFELEGAVGRPVYILTVVELETGEASDAREWESAIFPRWKPGEFESMLLGGPPVDPNEPPYARWTISPTGKWERIDATVPQPPMSFPTARSASGQWRLLGAIEQAGADETLSQMNAFFHLAGTWVVAYHRATNAYFLINTESKGVRPLDVPRGVIFDATMLNDGETLVVSDMRDDIRVIHAPTGKLIAWEASGSLRRDRLQAAAIAAVAIALIWLVIAFREKALFWALVDSLIVVITFQLVLGIFFVSNYASNPGGVSAVFKMLHHAPRFALVAGNVGAAILVGWYWCHGRGRLLERWSVGLLWLAITATPYALLCCYITVQTRVVDTYPYFFVLGVLLSNVTSLLVTVPRSIGWTIYHGPPDKGLGRFGLSTFFLVLTAICVLIPLARWLFSSNQLIGPWVVMSIGIGPHILGIGLVAILFLRVRWYVSVVAAVLLIAAIAAAAIPLDWIFWSSRTADVVYMFLSIGVVGTAIGIVLPCFVLRAHGWHWVREKKEEPSTVNAANLQPA